MRLGPYFDPDGAAGAVVAPPPAAPAAEAPRDPNTGRFSKAAIEKVAGTPTETPPVNPTAPAPAPAPLVTPEKPIPPTQPESDVSAAIEAFIKANPDPTAPAPAAQPQQPTAPATPQTPEILQAQQWAQNPQQAAEAVNHVRVMSGLNQAMNRGDVEGALSHFAPQAVEAIKEHLFQKFRDEFSQRIVDEGNGVRRDPMVGTLQQQVAALTAHLQQQQTQQDALYQQATQRQTAIAQQANLRKYTDGLFDSARLKDSPYRGWIEGRMALELSQNPQAIQNINAGRYGDIGAKFHELYKQFQPLLTTTAVPPQPAAQSGSTQLMTAAAGTSTGSPAPAKSDLVREDGGISGKGIASRLKSMLRAV